MKNKYIYILMLFIGVVFASCDNEDYTGDSTLTPSSSSISFDLGEYGGTISFVEQDSVIEFSVILSEPQIVDLVLPITMIDGNATLDADFEISNSGSQVTIPANATTGTVVIKTLADDEVEEEEFFTIQVGDATTGNATFTPQTLTVTLLNAVSGDLGFDLSWATTDVYSVGDGTVYDATDVADLILTLYDSDGTEVSPADGAALTIESNAADGTYTLVASISSAIVISEGYSLPFADLEIDYLQSGVQSGVEPFASALDLNQICNTNAFEMFEIVKAGSNYTITRTGVYPFIPSEDGALVGAYTGVDSDLDGLSYTGVSQIVGSISTEGTVQMAGFNVDFMQDVWGETVLTSVPVNVIVDYSTNTFEIPEQYIFTTLYDGSNYDYTIYGSGRFEACQMVIEYEMNQDGFLVAAYLNEYEYMTDELFTAVVEYP